MSWVPAIDAIALLVILATVPVFLRGQRQASSHEMWLALGGLLLLTAFRNLSNVLEWAGITGGLDPFEDFAELLLPVAYFMVFFSFLQDRDKRELTKSEERYRTLVENVDLGVTLINSDYRIVMTNGKQGALFHKASHALVGRYCYQEFEKRDAVCAHCPGRRAMETGQRTEVETEGVRDDGSHISARIQAFPVFDDEGGVSGFIELVEDITGRKAAEQTVRETEARLQSILRAAPVGIGVVVDRVFGWTNERLHQTCGYSGEELEGKSARMLYPTDEDYEFVGRDKYEQITAGGTGTVETRWKCKDGTVIDVLLSSTPIDPDNLAAGVTFTVMDISERKRAEQERLNLERQIQHAQKLESLGVLAGGIAHDFNNLLMGVLGNAELALLKLPAENPIRDNVRNIETAAVRAADLAKQMLAYSGKGRFVVEPIRLDRVVEETAHLLETVISKKAVLKFNHSANLPAIEADATQIRQVLMNLITNASEAIGDDSGVITVNTGVVEANRAYLAETYLDEELPDGFYAYIEVADTGCGMDKETREKIFDPFFTTKFSGRGLGLAAALGIIRGHQGAIKVYSEPECGTSIKALFPVLEAAADTRRRERPEQPVAGGDWRGEGMILVVDDEEAVCTVAKMALEEFGFSVLTAEDGREGLRVFREHADEVAVVLLDMTMPHLNGEETYREMRKVRPDVRVILSSGYNEQEATNRFVGKGLAGFIQKPYRPTALIEKLRRILQ